MAWTAPRTWLAGETVTKTIMDTHLRDNLNALATCFVKGGAFWNPSGIGAAYAPGGVWVADHACTVTSVKGWRAGGTGATVNARVSKPAAAAVQVWNVDDTPSNNAFIDETSAFNSATADDVTLFPATEAANDYVAFGYSTPFRSLRLVISTPGVGVSPAVAWEYWNGATWAALTNVVDGTAAFTAAAGTYHVTWDGPPADWGQNTINSVAAYYVRARITTVYATTNPKLTQGWIIPGGQFLASALSLTSYEEVMNGGAVQNTAIALGDRLEIQLVSVTGSPTLVGVQIGLTLA